MRYASSVSSPGDAIETAVELGLPLIFFIPTWLRFRDVTSSGRAGAALATALSSASRRASGGW